VEDILPYLDKAKELGGSVDQEKTEIPSIGWYAHVLDPDGNIVGLFQEPEEKK
jgi:predicted enzyme related to lactoylglutathione lyase